MTRKSYGYQERLLLVWSWRAPGTCPRTPRIRSSQKFHFSKLNQMTNASRNGQFSMGKFSTMKVSKCETEGAFFICLECEVWWEEANLDGGLGVGVLDGWSGAWATSVSEAGCFRDGCRIRWCACVMGKVMIANMSRRFLFYRFNERIGLSWFLFL